MAAIVNLLVQRCVFAPGATLRAVLGRFLIAEGLIMAAQQGMFLYLLSLRARYYPVLAHTERDAHVLLMLRLVTQASVFAAVSFPLRRHWVFGGKRAWESPRV